MPHSHIGMKAHAWNLAKITGHIATRVVERPEVRRQLKIEGVEAHTDATASRLLEPELYRVSWP